MSFRLAPMDRLIWILTLFMAPLPLVLLVFSTRGLLVFPALFVALIYAYILLWLRPLRFELDGEALTVVWPLRRFRMPYSTIEGVRVLADRASLEAELGWAMRIGAGGPWGGFGLLKTERRGMMRFYVSRMTNFVMIVPNRGKAWLVSPAEHEQFARALEAHTIKA